METLLAGNTIRASIWLRSNDNYLGTTGGVGPQVFPLDNITVNM